MEKKYNPQIPKCPTGIQGLDEITNGGLPQGRPTLICGGAGCGKTLFGVEFLLRGATIYKEPGVLMTFEETTSEITQNVASLGWNLTELIAQNQLLIDHVHIDSSEMQETGEYDLEALIIRLDYAIKKIGAKRVFLDTIEVLFSALSDVNLVRLELRRLFSWLKNQGVTALITGERGEHSLTRQGLEEYVSDCVVKLEQKTIDELATRTLQIVKYRGSRHSNNEYPFLIEENGISVIPITSLTLEHTVSNERISTGIPELDIMFDGQGYYRGSSILVTGKAVTGKTTLAAYFAQSTCLRGERCLYLATEESPQQIIRNLTSVGFDLKLYMEQDLLKFDAVRSTNYNLEMRLFKIHRWLESFQPTTIIIDPMSSLILSGSLIQTKNFFTRLIDYLKSKQITIFMTDLTPGEADVEHEGAAIRISSLMDTWIDLQVVKTNGERNRILYILKSRGMAHSNQLREFILTDTGVKLVEAYIGEGNILTGTERMNKELENQLIAKKRIQKFEITRREFEQEKHLLEAQLEALQMQLFNKDAELALTIEDEKERVRMLIEKKKFMKELREAHQ